MSSELKEPVKFSYGGLKTIVTWIKWAKVAHNSVFTPGKQDFRNNVDLPNGNSWLYIFSYRYPNLDLTKKLDKILAKYPKNGCKDGYIGFGLGCIYAVAKEARQ